MPRLRAMRVVYTGPAPAVRVPEAGDLLAEREKPVEVPADVGRRLIEQGQWRAAAPRRRRRNTTTNDEQE